MKRCEECIHFEVCDALERCNGVPKISSYECGCYKNTTNVVTIDVHEALKQRAVEKAKAEVAREIFAEIDEIFVDYKIDRCLEKRGLRRIVSNGEDIEQKFAELKKKYTEENV